MSRKLLGVVVPLVASVLIVIAARFFVVSPPVFKGLILGFSLALVQSWISVFALDWSWTKKYVYWVWGAGMFFRMAVFGITAFVIMKQPGFNFIATMLSLVIATTIFLVIESFLFFGKR